MASEALKQKVFDAICYCAHDDHYDCCCPYGWSEDCRMDIYNDLRAVFEDTVYVVRCRECKYLHTYDDGTGHIGYLCKCEGHDFMSVRDNWYCADGERKDEQ